MGALDHSPTPWRADKEIVEDANGWAVADCEFIGYTTVASENAALICRAVNCHADLLAALKRVTDRTPVDYATYQEAMEQARAAIKKAEAE